ncbi:DUF6886 family protein [Paenisporosarcina cavernae]|uniref:Uncharacterized protein n=1 Tax=Paenisporosarcina cavernae TaxID=2320858 RepID=A0A385YW50_9BACL|nr:DUF6886 family protein [Paenisporosarcina cavernae]AYC30520.1 hypothetical protein D3873_12005 [Paenisporosarcina cavernae]
MRLFHVSEEADIAYFEPRIPTREDMDKSQALVWAIDEAHLPNFLTPRNCPRVCYHVSKQTTELDRKLYFQQPDSTYGIVLEKKWEQEMQNTDLYLYEFDSRNFKLLDAVAGYYVSKHREIPSAVWYVSNPLQALNERQVEVRFVDNLWEAHDAIMQSSFDWSMCRMKYAQSSPGK